MQEIRLGDSCLPKEDENKYKPGSVFIDPAPMSHKSSKPVKPVTSNTSVSVSTSTAHIRKKLSIKIWPKRKILIPDVPSIN